MLTIPRLSNPLATVYALCVDLSLTNTGWALVRLPLRQQPNSGPFVNPVLRCGDIPLKDAQRPLAERINDLCEQLQRQAQMQVDSGGRSIDPWFMATEIPQHTYYRPDDEHPKGQHAIMVQQRTFGAVIQHFQYNRRMPVLEVSPNDTKYALTGSRNASKNAVGAMLQRLFLGHATDAWPKGWSEGVRDAIAVAYWLDGELSRLRQGAPSALAKLATGADDAPQDPDPGPRQRRSRRKDDGQAAQAVVGAEAPVG